MHLKVGELARSTGLTVRTLHHYDEIGLVKPSGRSEAGYRLYAEADVARLHAVQALRHLGLPLAEIAPVLDGQHGAPDRIIEQQLRALDQQIRQASELRARLSLLREGLLKGETPSLADWLQSLSLMTTYGRYFSAGEIRTIMQAWGLIETEWLALLAEVRAAMDAQARPDTAQVQALARRWMLLMHRWMGGDFTLIERWGEMYRREPSAHGVRGAPPSDMIAYMERAIEVRMALWQQHFGTVDLRAIRPVPDDALQAIERDGRKLLTARKSSASAPARALKQRWLALLLDATNGNPQLAGKLRTLHLADSLLLAGSPLSREVREYLADA